jgi:RimJ/RimL family protein N-acetyltransferase
VPVVRGLELAAFAHPDDERLALDYLADQERRGCIRADWRFAHVDAAGAVGARVAYWAPPGAAAPLLVDCIHDDAAGTAGAVLGASLAALSIGAIDYMVARPDPAARGPRGEPPALEAHGFALVAIQHRLAHTGPVPPTAVPDGVALRSVADVGYDAIAQVFPAVQDASADRGSRDRDPAGELAMLQSLEHDPTWWEVALDRATGAPLGFVAPALTGDGGSVIAMIGVAAGARGRGIGRCLLAAGTANLRRAEPTARIIADVDEDNAAMLRAAAAVGYAPFGSRAHYRRER